ncbi:MAG: protein kinase [Deltaproteobacteria bacterium]|nr:protein kinase [Deltaproteobacteria bacterium]
MGGRYEVRELIASGGMGRVFSANQIALSREVALKVLIPRPGDKSFRSRFLLEASILARLVHRHIVTIYDYGETEGGDLFIAMEYLEGQSLSSAIAKVGRMPAERACSIAMQMGRALRAAHAKGVVHRDLKPRNVMLIRDEEEDDGEKAHDFVKVLDFGLVKVFDNESSGSHPQVESTRAGMLLGSPKYMAPEQILSRAVDPRTDVYALGAVLYHMLTGRPPFAGASSVDIMHQHLRTPAPPMHSVAHVGEEIPPELEVIVARALEKSPRRRHSSMDELLSDLKAAARLISDSEYDSGSLGGSMVASPDGDARLLPSISGSDASHDDFRAAFVAASRHHSGLEAARLPSTPRGSSWSAAPVASLATAPALSVRSASITVPDSGDDAASEDIHRELHLRQDWTRFVRTRPLLMTFSAMMALAVLLLIVGLLRQPRILRPDVDSNLRASPIVEGGAKPGDDARAHHRVGGGDEVRPTETAGAIVSPPTDGAKVPGHSAQISQHAPTGSALEAQVVPIAPRAEAPGAERTAVKDRSETSAPGTSGAVQSRPKTRRKSTRIQVARAPTSGASPETAETAGTAGTAPAIDDDSATSMRLEEPSTSSRVRMSLDEPSVPVVE